MPPPDAYQPSDAEPGASARGVQTQRHMSDMTDRDRSSLDTDAGPGSQGEADPGSQGDFTGAPMEDERRDEPATDEVEGSEPPQPGG